MKRSKKRIERTSVTSLRWPNDLLDAIDQKAHELMISRNDLIVDMARSFLMSEEGYCRLKAKLAAQDLYYWKSRAEAMKAEPEVH